MGAFAVGDVVIIGFPYADFSRLKNRPALIVAKAEFNNIILCQITSKAEKSRQAIQLQDTDFSKGTLQLKSYIRPDKLFTAEKSIATAKAGSLNPQKLEDVRENIRKLILTEGNFYGNQSY